MKIVVLTALIGGARVPLFKPTPEADVRYVCVTDAPRSPEEWEYMSPEGGLSPRQAARRAKLSTCTLFPEADATIWMDAAFDLLARPQAIVSAALATGRLVVGFPHPDWSSLEKEAQSIIRNRQANTAAIERQLATYRRLGFHRDQLTTTGFLVRVTCQQVRQFEDEWWQELRTHTLRDQMSVDFVAWRRELEIGYLPGHYRDNLFARYNRSRRQAIGYRGKAA